MEISREDLLKHKAALQQQLEWIDQQLAKEGSTQSPPTGTPTPQPTEDPGREFAEANRRFQAASAAAPTPAPVPPEPAATVQPAHVPDLSSKAPMDGLSGTQKLGCAAVAIGICLGILFALFALPYLLYD
ncbi:hypothetical protein [Ruficoccus sp. ZRK36]|uniref:hypothetical protein n=1 Tax=Ruficoccus sp. ZRK36 TaxID=2866311 RepID=UPI001C72E29F|nr:hypothetical protein [Ruficoccus sp. ZRK36]QYY35749.1 hypothetical protein K0V07_15795 [Ruficoccus sp. ZRK36]